MKKKFTEAQIVFALRQAESGTLVAEIIRKMEISEVTFYRWKQKYAGMGVSELRRLRQLEEENRQLKRLVADLTLDKVSQWTSPGPANPWITRCRAIQRDVPGRMPERQLVPVDGGRAGEDREVAAGL
jgi:putative transposase